jgi:hypothetical protein
LAFRLKLQHFKTKERTKASAPQGALRICVFGRLLQASNGHDVAVPSFFAHFFISRQLFPNVFSGLSFPRRRESSLEKVAQPSRL